jgi:hypothetical protein
MNIRRADNVAWRRIDQEVVVVHLTRRWMYSLNDPGGRIWEMLETPLVGDRLDGLLGDKAAVAFLADLAAEGLVDCDGLVLGPPETRPSIDGSEPPRIVWREEVRRVAQRACSLLPAQNPLCLGDPHSS